MRSHWSRQAVNLIKHPAIDLDVELMRISDGLFRKVGQCPWWAGFEHGWSLSPS
jgi:hypothetical protein